MERLGETWETVYKALMVCPNSLHAYIQKVEEEDAKAHAVNCHFFIYVLSE